MPAFLCGRTGDTLNVYLNFSITYFCFTVRYEPLLLVARRLRSWCHIRPYQRFLRPNHRARPSFVLSLWLFCFTTDPTGVKTSIANFFHDLAHLIHSFLFFFIESDLIGQNFEIHIIGIGAIEIVHEFSELCLVLDFGIDIDDMGTVSEIFVRFSDDSIDVVQRFACL